MPSSPSDRGRKDPAAGLLAETPAGDNAPPLTVSEISGALKRTVEDRFGRVRVRGEISGFKRAASGHCYLALKDDRAVLDGVIWRSSGGRTAFAVEDGLDVVATGKLTTYPGRSKYQIVIERLELAGQGALMQLLEKRRKALAAEGLFDRKRKRPLPFLPKTIGVVTSPTGAVIRDILHRLEDRMPSHVIVWPAIVQGEGAAGQVARAIAGFGGLDRGGPVPRPDLLIVARGGGSIEDLWAFNEEIVVRAVAASPIPVISAVGHETDTTLCDHAADIRAPTPSAAAELAVPVRREIAARLAQDRLRAEQAANRLVALSRERLVGCARGLPRPAEMISTRRQQADECGERLPKALRARLNLAAADFARRGAGLRPALLARRMDRAGDRLDRWRESLPGVGTRRLAAATDRLSGLTRLLRQLDPRGPLSRGFALVEDDAGRLVKSAAAAHTAGRLRLEFADGTLRASVEGKRPRPYVAKRSRSQGKDGQTELFE